MKSREQRISEYLREQNLPVGFEAAARFQALKRGASWINTYDEILK